MVNTVFIILHYKTIEETLKCIQSLLKLDKIDDCRIVVYDNGSEDGSFERMGKKYDGHPIVHIYQSHINLGFSEGNNSAYIIAQSFSPQFIITLNNDVCIFQKNFLSRMEQIYREHNFYILGPDIYAPYLKAHQNPLYVDYPSLEQLDQEMQVYRDTLSNIEESSEKERRKRRKTKIRRYIPMAFLRVFRIVKTRVGIGKPYKEDYKIPHSGSVLHGACLIFSQLYLKDNKKLFEPDTKFYHEELLLTLKCQTLGYTALYSPELQVLHYHGVSTQKSAGSIQNYLIFHSQSMLDAYVILKKAIKDNPWQKNH